MSAEEKRQEHQKELAQRLNGEARERLRGLKTDTTEKKWDILNDFIYVINWQNIHTQWNKLS